MHSPASRLRPPPRIRRGILAATSITAGLALAVAGGSMASAAPATSVATAIHYKMDLGGYDGPEPTSSKITIRIMRQSWSDSANAVFDKTVKAFEKAYPNVTVKQQLVPYGNLSTNLQSDVAASNVPDIVMGRSDFVTAYNYGDIAAPVGDYFSKSFKNDYTKSLRDSVTIGGKMYALPWENQLQLLEYNADIFKEAGVTPPPDTTNPNDGWTVDQWFTAFDKLRTWMDSSGNSSMYPLASSGFGNGGPGSNYAQLESTWIRMQGSPTAAKGSNEYKSFAGVSANGLSVQGYINNALAI
jgi:multiple sugar transport system substrate-binding protein